LNITKGNGIVFNASGLNDAQDFLWNFGEGANPQTSTETINVFVIYSSIGSKTITLTVNGPGGTKVITKSNFINVSETAPIVNFTVNNSTPFEQENIIFNSTCLNNPSDFLWNFGSGATPATAIGEGPHSVKYSSWGYKTISLAASNASGSNVETKNNLVNVKVLPPIAAISVQDTCEENQDVIISSACQGTITNYMWNFGSDAEPSIATNSGPHVVQYNKPGEKRIELVVANSSGSDTATAIINVNYGRPVADFTVSSNYIVPGMSVVFTKNCTNTIDDYSWVFGPTCQPMFASGPGPHSVKYLTSGVFDAKLSVQKPGRKR